MLASAMSDAVKTPANFIVHNVHGAQAAKRVLERMNLGADVVEDVVKAVLEHQIGPPRFMAFVGVAMGLKGAGVDSALVGSITAKIADPLNDKNLTADKSQIAFSPDEKAALEKIGVLAWTVPHEGSRHYAAARAVIDADSLVNYACPDGWAKLAALHGPDQPLALREPLLIDGLVSLEPGVASARSSFRDARSVISPDVLPLYDRGLARTEQAVKRVMSQLERWAQGQPPGTTAHTADGKFPYLDGKLDYTDPKQMMFARRLRDEGVRLLRQEELIG